MKKLVWTIFALFTGLQSKSQTLTPPYWSLNDFIFETAKIKDISNLKRTDIAKESFKTCTIRVRTLNTESIEITIDMPDLFFIKEASVSKVSYDKQRHSAGSIVYTAEKDGRICIVTFNLSNDIPQSIAISFSDVKNNPGSKTYLLTEIK